MSSALPKAVQKQIKRADEIAEQITAAAAGEPDPNLAVVTDPPADPPAEPTTPVAEPATLVADPATPAEPAAEPAPDDKGTWQHKYKVLQGKYNAEVPRLQKASGEQDAVLKDMRQQLTNTQALLASLSAERTPATPSVPVPPLVNPDEIETYGADLHDFIQRVARGEATTLVDAAAAPVSERVSRVEKAATNQGETLAQSRQVEMLRVLSEAVPEWEAMNTQAEFLVWLDEIDPFTNRQRGDLLTMAFKANDATRVIAFFKGFQNENAAVTPEPGTPAPVVETPETPAVVPTSGPQVDLEGLVAPGAPNAPTASAPNEAGKRVWTQPEVAELYRQKNEFVKKGVKIPEELDKLERDLFKAQKEGRIRGS